MKVSLLTLSIALFCAHGCKPLDLEKRSDPDINDQGEYFNCYIDGKYWTFKERPYSSDDPLTAKVSFITHPSYEIQASNNTGYPITVLAFYVPGTFPSKDTFELRSTGDTSYATIYGPNADFPQDFVTNEIHTGKIIFSKRTPERLEGIFYFDAYRPDTNVIIHVTNGRFSLIPN